MDAAACIEANSGEFIIRTVGSEGFSRTNSVVDIPLNCNAKAVVMPEIPPPMTAMRRFSVVNKRLVNCASLFRESMQGRCGSWKPGTTCYGHGFGFPRQDLRMGHP